MERYRLRHAEYPRGWDVKFRGNILVVPALRPNLRLVYFPFRGLHKPMAGVKQWQRDGNGRASARVIDKSCRDGPDFYY